MGGAATSLIFMNIPSYSGGLDPWGWAKARRGVVRPANSPQEDVIEADGTLRRTQDFGDGRLECVSYSSAWAFVEEFNPVLRGSARCVYSGAGPLKATFVDGADFEKATKHCKGRVYLQIDGEYFAVTNPKSVVIRWARTVRVLANVDKLRNCCGR